MGAPLWDSLGQDNGLKASAELLAPLATIAAVAALALAVGRLRRAPVAMAVTLWGALVVQGFWINPMLDASRSGAAFMRQVEAAVPIGTTLGLVNYREQFLLQASRPVVNFGHRRWREGQQEVYEASAWLSAGSANAPRALLVEGALLAECFATAQRRWVARASRQSWYLVTGVASPTCVARGATGRLAR